jgi:molybdopterin converting factor subunit 1
MNVHVQLFARARDLAGAGSVSVEMEDDPTVGSLRQALVQSRPALKAIAGSLHIAVNGDYADDTLLIPAQAEVACFPPVSGG